MENKPQANKFLKRSPTTSNTVLTPSILMFTFARAVKTDSNEKKNVQRWEFLLLMLQPVKLRQAVFAHLALRMPYTYLPHNYNAVPCDMYIEVAGEQLPVHSLVIQIHSTVLGDMITSLKAKGARGAPVVVNLPEQEHEVELMLKFIYGMEHHVRKFRDAVTLFHLGNKYDISALVVLCEPMICDEVNNMHFCGVIDPRSSRNLSEMSESDKEVRDLGKWLSYSERHQNKNLLVKCQHSLMVTLLHHLGETGEDFAYRAMVDVLSSNGVGPRTLCSVAMAFAVWSQKKVEKAGEQMVGDSDGVLAMLASFNGFDHMEPAGQD
ncbi:hypothetical protein BSKO_13999 [Bryopsis sp. KO-2023]|nr:hypothetical protein BSKO_13999 [Bryopsis sp. KO-2023]